MKTVIFISKSNTIYFLFAFFMSLVVNAQTVFVEPDNAAVLQGTLDRLDGPLRVAIAGKVKAGKSTLLNALVGERLAPTDTGECTKVVTWYRDGHTYQVTLHPKGGSAPVQARFHRDEGAIEIDLDGGVIRLPAHSPVERIVAVMVAARQAS